MKKLLILITLFFIAMYATAQPNCYVPSMNGPVKLSNSMLYCNVQDSVDVTKILGFGNSGYSRVLTLGSGLTVTDSVISASGAGWGLTGNAGTNPATNFIGTTDSVDFVIKSDNIARATFFRNSEVNIISSASGLGSAEIGMQPSSFSVTTSDNVGGAGAFGISSQLNFGGTGNAVFQTNTGDGNVGIGTSSPATKLDIIGSFNQAVTDTFTGYTIINSISSKVPEGLLFQSMGSGTGNFSGSLAIEPSASTLLHTTDTSNTKIALSDTGFVFTTFGGDAMAIRNNGNVGIGTVLPSSRLHVYDLSSGDSLNAFFGDASRYNITTGFNIEKHKSAENANYHVLQTGSILYLGVDSLGDDLGKGRTMNLTFNYAANEFSLGGELPNGSAINTTYDLANSSIQNTATDGVLTTSTQLTVTGFSVGGASPASKLQVTAGDVYIDTVGSGVIQKSPDGNCWRISIDNAGAITAVSITCP